MLGKRSRICSPTIRWKSAYSSTSVANGPLHHDSLRLGEDHEKTKSCNLLRFWHLTTRSFLPANSDDQLLRTAGPGGSRPTEASSRELAPWVDMSDLARRGLVVVWEETHLRARPEEWRETFGPLNMEPILVLARQTWNKKVAPARILYAFVPPRP